MSKKNMKRVALDSHESQSIDEEAKLKFKYQRQLQLYLDLQKKFVADKRKLEIAEEKKQMLLDEVRFLRRRYRYLMKMPSQINPQQDQDHVPQQNSSIQSEETVFGKKDLRVKKKTKNCLIDGKKRGKRKILSQR